MKKLLLLSAFSLAVTAGLAQTVVKSTLSRQEVAPKKAASSLVVPQQTMTKNLLPMRDIKQEAQTTARKSGPRKLVSDGIFYSKPAGTYFGGWDWNNGGLGYAFTTLLLPPFVDHTYVNRTEGKSVWSINGNTEGVADNVVDNNYVGNYGVADDGIAPALFYAPTVETKFGSYTIGEYNYFVKRQQTEVLGIARIDSMTCMYTVDPRTAYYEESENTYYSSYFLWGALDNDNLFGTGGDDDWGNTTYVVQVFNKPVSPLYISRIYAEACTNTQPIAEGAELKAYITKTKTVTKTYSDGTTQDYVTADMDNILGTFIATAADTLDFVQSTTRNGKEIYLGEIFFDKPGYEDVLGNVIPGSLVIDEEFAVVIDGLNDEGIDVGFEGISVEEGDDNVQVAQQWCEIGNFFVYNSPITLAVSLYGMYDKAYAPKVPNFYTFEDEALDYTVVRVPVEGSAPYEEVYGWGNVTDGAVGSPFVQGAPDGSTGYCGAPVYTALMWFDEDENSNYDIIGLPDWISQVVIDTSFGYGMNQVMFYAEPLPEGMAGRKATIKVVGQMEIGTDEEVDLADAKFSTVSEEITIIQGEPSDEPPVEEMPDGKYYLVNVASTKCWGAGNDWGTRASLVDNPEYVTLLKQPDGTYLMESQVSNGGESYYFNGDYMDQTPALPLTITKSQILGYADDAETQPVYAYTVANGDNYFGYDGSTTVLGKNLAADSENALWVIASQEEALAGLSAATAEDPMNATFLILDPNFGRNNRNVGAWQVSEDCTNKNLSGGNNVNNCAESYHSVFTVSQLLEGVPNGVYALTAQGFYRQDGEDNENLPYFFINDEKATVPLKTGNENSMSNASESFSNGLYTIEPIYVEVKDGTINLGAKLENNTELWVIWDNFTLLYYGADANIDEVRNAAIIAQLDELKDKAEDLQEQVDNDVVKAALADALAAAAGVTASSSVDDIKAAIATLTAAIDVAEGNLIAKNVIPAMKSLVDATNVYTEEALNEYFTQWNDKYEAGSLTKAEASSLQNPDVVTGWHAAITVDNFLLSAWDTNPDFNNAPYYINTWSVEGDNDGTNFHVPFFEYWTGDDGSLAERTMTATMENLEPGNYDVSAWVRVRTKNYTGSYTQGEGITLQVNEGAAVDVAKGTNKVDLDKDNNFFLDEFTASGIVGEDGVLKIKFNVAADNNISWLSFKNVMFKKGAAADDPELVAPEGWISEIQNGNLAGDDVSNFVAKEYPSTEAVGAAIVAGAGKNGSRGIVVKSQDKVSQAWDSQFWIVVNENLPEGTKLHVEFDYKADKAGSVGTQSHGAPGAYQHWAAIGNVEFDSEWKHFNADVNVEGAMADMLSIAFNLNDIAEANTYYFDNFGVWIQKPAPINDWVNILTNSDMEDTDVSCFFKTEQGVGGPMPADITDGIGVDGSRAIAVQSADDPANNWDTQFFVRLPKSLPAGTKYKVEFDYKADKEGAFETQSHVEPGNYIYWDMIGTGTFTTEWQHYVKQSTITADQSTDDKAMQTVAFNLSLNKVATQFIFDNVTFSVEKDYYETGIRELFNNARNAENIFNLRGQKVEKPSKGLYIINGKKVVVK